MRIFVIMFLLSLSASAQVYQGNFYVKAVHKDTSYCDMQHILFGFKKDTVAFRVDGMDHIFTKVAPVRTEFLHPASLVWMRGEKEGVEHTLLFITDRKHVGFMLRNNRKGYPHYFISSKNICN